MQVLNLINQNNCQINIKLGKEFGTGGADGQVFEIIDDPYRVIKLAVCFDNQRNYSDIESVLRYIIQYHPCAYARAYEINFLGNFTRQIINNEHTVSQEYFLYYYVLEKLSKISEDEKKVFHSILSHEDRNIEKNYSFSKVKRISYGLGRGLDFDYNKVIEFYKNLSSAPIKHLDLHVRNIMKDNEGNFKLIDFDRLKIRS